MHQLARRVGRGSRIVRQVTAVGLSAALAAGVTPTPARAEEPDPRSVEQQEAEKYLAMNLEDLLKINVTSVAGVASSFMASPAAIAVLTGDDLRRGGFQSIAEAFRAVPGMQVARVGAHGWAISVRGFNSGFAEKLLVLVDGRVVYDPLFNGVFWDIQDLVLEDLDRIEIIRGPGATLWGANAVSGVINITTKNARQTQGVYVTGGGGSEERGFGAARFGGRIGRTHYRVWAKHLDRDGFVQAGTGRKQPDDWNLSRAGLRLDHETSPRTTLSLDAELYDSNRLGTTTHVPAPGHLRFDELVEDVRADGGHLRVRLADGEGADSGWSAQGYFSRTHRDARSLAVTESDTFDLDVRRHFTLGKSHMVLVGAGGRRIADATTRGVWLGFDPASRTFTTYSAFVQDTVKLPGNVSLMLGSKFEDNDFTGFEFQPSARAAWTPDDRRTLWVAVSRPVRTPARPGQDYDVTVLYADPGLLAGGRPLGLVVPVKLLGNPTLQSEKLWAFEGGFRARLGARVSFEAAAYVNDYHDLVTTPLGQFGRLDNLATATGRGVELAVTLQASDRLRLDAAYTYTSLEVGRDDVQILLRDAPHLANLRARLDATRDLEVNGALYFTDALRNTPSVDAYVRADLGVTWRPTRQLELAVWGQDLLDDRHPEFPQIFPAPLTEVERGFYGQITFRR